jgi:hypothetical protein
MIVAIIWVLFGVISLGLYNALLLLDSKTPEGAEKEKIKKEWHSVGAAIFIYLSVTAWQIWGVEYIPFCLSCFWCLFAGIVHMVGLDKPFFYVGTTAKTDILIRKISPNNPQKISAILKISALVLSLLIL